MWGEQDQGGFREGLSEGTGQVNEKSVLGKACQDWAKNENYHTYLEVGTWNGLGTTKVIHEALKKRSDSVEGGYTFYSLECNSEKSEIARMFYRNEKNVHILNEVLANPSEKELEEAFPVLKDDPVLHSWSSIDNKNIKTAKLFLERQELPEIFDVVLLDGGEFTTLFDFYAIRNRARVLLLDDTNSLKCSKIAEILREDSDWDIVIDDKANLGCLVAERRTFSQSPDSSKEVASASIVSEISESRNYNQIPIVIHHEGGDQEYFQNSVKFNASRNPVIVIGDDSNKHCFTQEKERVEHVHVSSLRTEEIQEFEKCYTNYSFENSQFELKCFLRAFYLKELIRQKGLKKVFYVDSDCVILENVDALFMKLENIEEAYSIQKYMQRQNKHHKVGCIHNALLTETMCDDFVKLCFSIYKTKEKAYLIEDKWEFHQSQQSGGICDMTLWFLLLQHRNKDSTPVTDLNDVVRYQGEDCVFDHNVNDAYGYAGPNTFMMGPNEDISSWGESKVVRKKKNKYYVMTQDGRELRLLSIHYQGHAKGGLAKNSYCHD